MTSAIVSLAPTASGMKRQPYDRFQEKIIGDIESWISDMAVFSKMSSRNRTKLSSNTFESELLIHCRSHLTVANALILQELREVISQNRFTVSSESDWPTASLNRMPGHAQLRPPESENPLISTEERNCLVQDMWEQRKFLSDTDADVLDALSAVWLDQARNLNDDATSSIDDLLRLRGLKPKLSGAKRRGGFTPEQRATIAGALTRLHNIWMIFETDVPETGGRKKKRSERVVMTRPFILTDAIGQVRLDDGRFDMHEFMFRPGKMFARFLWGPWRQNSPAFCESAAL